MIETINTPTFLTENTLVNAAYHIAKEAHDGQPYGDQPYIDHPVGVARLAYDLKYPSEIIASCLLHDVLEDTNLTRDDLITFLMPRYVIHAVESVTYTKADEQNGVDKIEKARSTLGGHATKTFDSSFNFTHTVETADQNEPEITMARIQRYSSFLARLTYDLPTPDDIRRELASLQG